MRSSRALPPARARNSSVAHAARPDARDLAIRHIQADGSLEDHRDFERRLVAEMGIDPDDLFAGDPVQDAYDALSAKMTGGR